MTAAFRCLLFTVGLTLAASATGGAVQQSPEERVNALMGLARVRRDAGDLPEARRLFDQARQVRPFSIRELGEYFWTLIEVDATAGLAVGRDVLTGAPQEHDIRDRMIAAAIARKDEATVETLATAGRTADPQSSRWPRRLAESYARQRKSSDAAAVYRDLVAASTATVSDRAGLAFALEAAGQFREAIDAWNAVPEATRFATPAWEQSRLRSLARLGWSPSTIAAFEAWLAVHPDDRAIRGELVEIHARISNRAAAITALEPLLTGPDAATWRRRKADLERPAAPTVTATSREPRPVDPWSAADTLANTGAFDRLAATLPSLFTPCSERALRLADRVPGHTGTTLLAQALRTPGCASFPAWYLRSIERFVAESRHDDARRLIEELPATVARTTDLQRLTGQLRLWTGDADGAVAVLAPLVASQPADTTAREALVDGYRALGQATRAWDLAAPLLADAALSTDRRVSLAELAVEADHPEQTARVLSGLPAAIAAAPTVRALEGRAALATGHPAAAVRVLSTLDRTTLTPSAALALVDAIAALRSHTAAWTEAEQFQPTDARWGDFVARRATLAAMNGRTTEADRDRTWLTRTQPELVPIADATTALERERPHEALTSLMSPRADARTVDLRAVAWAGTGDLATALAAVERLRALRPDAVALKIRAAELAWRLSPTDANTSAVLALPASTGGHERALAAAARTLAALDRHAEVIALLDTPAGRAELTVEHRIALARSLRARGRAREALDALGPADALSPDGAVVRAELVGMVNGPTEAVRLLSDLASGPNARPEASLALARVTDTAAARVTVLERAHVRFPTRADVSIALAGARRDAGEAAGSRDAADHALRFAGTSVDVWHELLAFATTSPDVFAVDRVMDRFRATAGDNYALVIAVVDRMASLVQSPDDPRFDHALDWVRDPAIPDALRLSRDVARIRLLAARESWDASIAVADRALAEHGPTRTLVRLRADVLSWAGRTDRALEAYDDYLTAAPEDLNARRQQARIAGWGGQYAKARDLYATLASRVPGAAEVTAEAAAKNAFFDGRWRDAVGAYASWLALEPDESEAQFEYAEALRATGDHAAADTALASLTERTTHRLAEELLERQRLARRPSVVAVVDARSADGFVGQRLIDIEESGLALRMPAGKATATSHLFAGVSHVEASNGTDRRAGTRLSAGLSQAVSRTVVVNARFSRWAIDDGGAPITQALGGVTVSPSDRWRVSASAEREPLFENLSTIDRRIVATGVTGGADRESPMSSIGIRIGHHELSDDNTRVRASATLTRALGEQWVDTRVVVWSELTSFSDRGAFYFSPSRFFRIDAGLEHTWRWSQPRFRGDRQDFLGVGYLIGTDNDRRLYHHPSARLSWELTRGAMLEARADAVRSSVYNDHIFTVSLRIGGGPQTASPIGLAEFTRR